MNSIADRLRQRSDAHVFGREAELAQFRQSLAFDPPPVNVFLVHGVGGVGKTTLLDRMQGLAAQAGLACVRLDGRDLEPSAYGVLQGLGTALGLAPATAQLQQVLDAWRQQPRRLLLIDAFEHLAPLEAWLRQHLLAALPQHSLVVLAGRMPPDDFWRTDPAWRSGTCVMALRNLAPQACDEALAHRGLNAAQREAVIRLTYGHPLALMLLADVIESQGAVPDTLGTDVIRRLTECFAAQAPSALHREALELCAHARVTTEDLLAKLVDEAAAPELFAWLASLSFVEIAASGGLLPHDLVRDALTAELRWRNPQKLAIKGEQLLRYHLARARAPRSDPETRLRVAQDIFFLNRHNPAMRPFMDVSGLDAMHCELASPEDLAPIAALVRQELGPHHEALLRHWQAHPAATLWAVHDRQGAVLAAMLCLDVAGIDPADTAQDPALAGFRQWLGQQAPLRADEQALCARLAVAQGGVFQMSAPIHALQARSFSLWMSQPRLAAFAMTVTMPAHWLPMMNHLDFHAIDPAGFEMDGQHHGTFVHDWRAVPIEDWLGWMASRVGPTPPAAGSTPSRQRPPLQVLSEAAHLEAVHAALKHWHLPAAFEANPLLQTRLVRTARAGEENPGTTLRRLILCETERLSGRPKDTKFFRALDLTYLRPAGSQELAAERLGLPFGTYRYQLRTAVARIAQQLWQQETQAQAPTPD